MDSDCAVTVRPSEPPLVVVTGEVNYLSAARIRHAFAQLEREGRVCLDLDCQSVEFIDSSGIGAIVRAAQALRRAGGVLRLRAATPQLVHALWVSGFADLLEIDTGVPWGRREGRRKGCAPGVWQQTSFSIPVRADTDSLVRRRVCELAESMPFTQEQIDDIKLAVGEAVSNAIRHGCWDGQDGYLTVRCTGDSQKLVVEIHNPGDAFDPDSIPTPDPASLREGGMGVFFMRSTMDKVEFAFDQNGTTVVMVKFLSMADGDDLN